MVREQDRPALRRIINAIFDIEHRHHEQLRAIAYDESISKADRVEKYVDFIIDHMEYVVES